MHIAKYFLFSSLSFSLLLSCGQSSKIKNPIEANPFGYMSEEFSLPIEPTAFESALPKAGVASPVVNQLVKLLLKVGAVKGAKKFSITQPIPELPNEYIQSVKLSRIFFIMENENISFLNKLAVLATPKKIQNEDGIMISSPTDEKSVSTKEEKRYLKDLFNPKSLAGQEASARFDREVVMIKYDRANPETSNTENLPYVQLINTSNPHGILDHLLYRMDFKRKGYIAHFEQMSDSVLIETIPDPAVKAILDYEIQMLSTQPEYGFINKIQCTPAICLDLKIEKRDIQNLVLKENSIQLDAFIDVDRAPGTFKLKGFVQFNATLKDPILVDGVGAGR